MNPEHYYALLLINCLSSDYYSVITSGKYIYSKLVAV